MQDRCAACASKGSTNSSTVCCIYHRPVADYLRASPLSSAARKHVSARRKAYVFNLLHSSLSILNMTERRPSTRLSASPPFSARTCCPYMTCLLHTDGSQTISRKHPLHIASQLLLQILCWSCSPRNAGVQAHLLAAAPPVTTPSHCRPIPYCTVAKALFVLTNE